MALETALNILWVCFGVSALGLLGWAESNSPRRGYPLGRLARFLSVFLAIIFLFPFVSESDDLLSVQNLQFTLETRGEVGNRLPHQSNRNEEKPGASLARFLDSLESVQIASLYLLIVALSVIAFVSVRNSSSCELDVQSAGGRAPPATALP